MKTDRVGLFAPERRFLPIFGVMFPFFPVFALTPRITFPIIRFSPSRGCTNQCSFCSESLTFGRGVRYHSPRYVVENVEQVVKKYPINGIYFHNNNFLSDPDRAAEICRKMISKGLHKKAKWCIQARSDHINSEIVKELNR